MKVPQFLIEMSEQMNNEDNRYTADPVWQVRCKRTRETSEEYTDMFQVVETDDHWVVAKSESDESINQQLVNHLDCDPEDLPIILEEWVDEMTDLGELSSGDEKIEYFIENFDCHIYDLDGFRTVWVEEYEDIVMGAFLTEQDANWFINRKQHDYPKLYTYVASMYFAPQMKELRGWIKSLTKEGVK
jgi:hypothetical protein